MAEKQEQSPTVEQSKKPLYISIGIVILCVGAYFLIPSVKESVNEAWSVLTSDDDQRVKSWVDQFGFMGPIIIMVIMILQMFLLVIPTPLLMIVSVLAYGPVFGGLLILGSVFLASSTGYAIGAYLGVPVVQRLLGEKGEKKVEDFIKDYGFWAVIVFRLSPFLSNDAISFVGGMLRMGYWKFIGATMVGITPLTILIAYLGKDINRLKTGMIWGSVICILLFITFVYWDKNRRAKTSH